MRGEGEVLAKLTYWEFLLKAGPGWSAAIFSPDDGS